MIRHIRIEISPLTIAVRVGSHTERRDDACIALRIRRNDVAPEVVAVGREAAELPERPGESRVDVLAATWWRVGEGMRWLPPRHEELGAPGQHDWLVAVAWPFLEETFSPEWGNLMLIHMLAAAIGCPTSDIPSKLYFARLELHLEGGLESGERRDDLVRALWGYWNERLRQGGRRVALLRPPSFAQTVRRGWLDFLFYPLCIGVMVLVPAWFIRSWPRAEITLGGTVFFGLILIVGWGSSYRRAYFRKPR